MAGAVSKLDQNTSEARQALYRRARLALVEQLRDQIQGLTEGDDKAPMYDDVRRATRHVRETFKLNLQKKSG
jgi:hypothetical protein